MSRFLDYSCNFAFECIFWLFFECLRRVLFRQHNLDLEMFVTKKNCIITASVNFPHSEYSTWYKFWHISMKYIFTCNIITGFRVFYLYDQNLKFLINHILIDLIFSLVHFPWCGNPFGPLNWTEGHSGLKPSKDDRDLLPIQPRTLLYEILPFRVGLLII